MRSYPWAARVCRGFVAVACCAVALVSSSAGQSPAKASDWPQFRGPNRDGLCAETGLLKQWPEGGPKLLWKIEGLGRGLSTVSVAGGRLFTMGDRAAAENSVKDAKKDAKDESQYVLAYDLATQKELWATRIGPPHTETNGGPRCVPTVDGELTYAIGTSGDLVCLETATGKVRWSKNFAKDFHGKMMSGWKYSESPLVDGDKLVCTPGGPDATLVALDKKTGDLIWKCAVPKLGDSGKDGASYSSMAVTEVDGLRQYVQIVGRGAVGVAAKTGEFLWGYNRVANGVANIAMPIVRGNYVFVSSGYKTGAALLKITRDGEKAKAEEVYFLGPDTFQNQVGGMVLVGDYIYSGDGHNKGVPICLNLLTGKVAWKPPALAGGTAGVMSADGNIIYRYQANGLVALVEATPEKFHVISSFKPPVNDGPAWPYPVISDGKLYLRSQNTLMCYDLRGARKE